MGEFACENVSLDCAADQNTSDHSQNDDRDNSEHQEGLEATFLPGRQLCLALAVAGMSCSSKAFVLYLSLGQLTHG